MNLSETTLNLATFSILSLIVTKSVLSLSKYKDEDIGEIIKSTVSNLTKGQKENDN